MVRRQSLMNIPPKLKDADDILNILGDPGIFQTIQFTLLMLQFVPIAMNDLMPIFYNIRPLGIQIPYYGISDINNNSFVTADDNSSMGYVYVNLSAACNAIHSGLPSSNFSYVYRNRQWSVIGEMDLLCDKAWLANLATTVYFLGQIIGSPIFGWTSDKYGRRKTLILSNIAYSLLSIGVIFSRDIISFSVLRFCVGLARQGMHSAFFVLMMEWIQSHRRGPWAAIAQFPFSAGVLLLALFGYLLQNWHHMQIVLAVSNFTAIGFYWFAPESLKWLILHHRATEAQDISKNLHSGGQPVQSHSFIDCFRTPYVRIFTVLCCYIWFATFFTYFAFSFLMTNMVGDVYTNLAISGCLELIPRALAVISAQKITNRAMLVTYFFWAGIFALITGAIPAGAKLDANSIAKTAMALLGRMAIVGCFPIVSVVSSELFPTAIRNSGFGLCSIAMKAGAMVAPQLALLTLNTSFTGIPFYIIGAVSVLGSVMTIILPETTDMKLMSTIAEAEEFGTRELMAFYKRKSVAFLTVMKPVKKMSLRERAKSIFEKIEKF
ncbi:organic cation transporter protein-like isoform X2 [Paramacrobiotus metropolitanus]|uniref:organic cation transporter protein-like isoform X2 n=1 Tax=Paramacrobiotus metropolitanus TaxID=2943436 RepID=UPI002446287C|nr:organic cation transporter protein-like isoform X2 [Paramacrobiotus metropolitanus]